MALDAISHESEIFTMRNTLLRKVVNFSYHVFGSMPMVDYVF